VNFLKWCCPYFFQPPLALLPIILPHRGAITIQATLICDHITVPPKSFIPQSDMSPRQTPIQELKEKHVFLALNLVSVRVFSFNWQIHVTGLPHSPHMLGKWKFTEWFDLNHCYNQLKSLA
jgi:hypothetical protein